MDPVTWLAVQKGLATWRAKPHNAKWWRRIDGTPIPNDLCVCIAEAVADARPLMPPTQWAYDQACKALDHWRDEAKRLGELAGVEPRQMKHKQEEPADGAQG